MRTTKSKRILSMIMAICLVFGSAGLLPQSADNATIMTASANEPQQQGPGQEQNYDGRRTEGNFDYFEDGEDNAVICDYHGEDNQVVVPATIGGRKVVAIGREAFSMNANLEKVTVPEGVTTLEPDAFSRCENLKEATLPSTLKSIEDVAFADCPNLTAIALPAGLESIGSEAFMHTGLTSVTIPDSVTSMDFRAFIECNKLETVAIGAGLEEIPESCFERCPSLKKVTMGNKVKVIESRAFDSCDKLSDLTLSDSLTTINNGAFFRCSEIKSVTLPTTLTAIGREAFAESGLTAVNIPDSVKSMDEDVFRGCNDLKSAALSKGMDYVPNGTFVFCGRLQSVTIPSGYKVIGNGAFNDCNELASITIPPTVEEIGDTAFIRTAISSVKLPDSVKTVGSWAFAYCRNLENVQYTANLTELGCEVFLDTPWFNKQKAESNVIAINDVLVYAKTGSEFTVPSNIRAIAGLAIAHNPELAKVTIPATVKSIGDNAFEDCQKLKQLDIPKSVEHIGMAPASFCDNFESYNVDKDNKNYASVDGVLFDNDKCTLIACPASKTSAAIPASVTTIAGRAFANCSRMTSIALPKTLKSIGTAAFFGCESLTSIALPDSVDSITNNAFENCKSLTSVDIPKSVAYLGAAAFRGCDNLEEVFIPEGVGGMSDEVFANCPKLKSILLPDSLQELGWCALGVIFTENPENPNDPGITPVKDFTIYGYDPNGVGKWYAEDFNGGMKYVTIGKNIRLAGSNRYATSAAVSSSMFQDSECVIIASGSDFPDALAGTTLAAAYGAPILLTDKNKLPDDIREEITRLGAREATILGGTGAVSDNVKNALEEMGLSVDRISGSNRYATAADIAKTAYLYNRRQAPENLFFVVGSEFADALSVSPVAGATNSPILFVPKNGKIDDATLSFIKTVKGRVHNVYVIGGTGAISEDMQKAIDTATGLKSERIAGKNRYETSTQILKKFAGATIPGGSSLLDSNAIAVATGANYPDALSASAVCALSRTPLMLVDGKNMTDAQIEVLKAQKGEYADRFDIAFVGGEGVIPEKYARNICMQIQIEQRQGGGEATKFEDTNLYKFLQKLDTESFETEIELNFMGGKTTSLIKKNSEAMYAKTTSPLDGEVEETYKVGGKTYVLNPAEKTYREENGVEGIGSILSLMLADDTRYEVISTDENSGLIIERIKMITKDGDQEKSSESVFRFSKATGALVSTESENGGMKMSAEFKSFKTGPLEIKLPDLSDWTKEDDDDDDDF